MGANFLWLFFCHLVVCLLVYLLRVWVLRKMRLPDGVVQKYGFGSETNFAVGADDFAV